MCRKHFSYMSSLIILACLLASVPIAASACASIEQATNSAKNKASEVMSQLNSSSNTTLTPPSTSYPVDIIGRVIIANSIMAVIVGSKEYPEPATRQGEFWIVQTSIRNKAFQTPVTPKTMWTINIASKPDQSVGFSGGVFAQSPITIPEGQSGEMVLCFGMVPTGLNPNDCQICLHGYAAKSGQIPNSYGKLVNSNSIAEVYDWDSQKVVQAGKRMLPAATQTDETFTIQGYVSQPFGQGKDITLKLIKSETGDRTKVIDFKTDKSPVLVVFNYTPTSQVASSMMLSYQGGDTYGSTIWTYPTIPPWHPNVCVIEGYGKYKLKVESSGCNWWVKIGVEQ